MGLNARSCTYQTTEPASQAACVDEINAFAEKAAKKGLACEPLQVETLADEPYPRQVLTLVCPNTPPPPPLMAQSDVYVVATCEYDLGFESANACLARIDQTLERARIGGLECRRLDVSSFVSRRKVEQVLTLVCSGKR